jgi:hypothetical protein
MALATLRVMLDDRIRDTAGILTTPQKDAALTEATKRYSMDYPTTAVAPLVGDGVTFSFPLAAPFSAGFSQMIAVEYPTGQQVPVFLEPESYIVVGSTVRLLTMILPLGDTANATYTALHTLSEAEDSIPAHHEEWVAWLAAAICCRQLAAYYAQTSESTLGADAAYFRSRSAEYLALAKSYELTYVNQGVMSASEISVRAASVAEDLDVTLERGFPRFYHSSRTR